MAVVAGIDEAGYGPILGPLVVTATAFRVPDAEAESDLWKALAGSVTRESPRERPLLRVADSKVVHAAGGLGALERTVLPFAGLAGGPPRTVRQLIALLGAATAEELDDCPWYRAKDRVLPRAAAEKEIEEGLARLRAGLRLDGAEFCWAQARCVDVPAFNREVAVLRNKSALSARRVGELMVELWERFAAQGLWLAVDKQGGRDDYEPFLLANFFGCTLVTHLCSAERSEYTLRRDDRRMRVVFEPRADDRRLPVALASMFSKYLRELLMELFNDFWVQRVPGLQPTAGYYTDGRRFLKEIDAARASAGIALDRVARSR
jgi:hypothetical protein